MSYADNVNYTVAGRKNEDLLPRVSKLIKDNRTYCWGIYLKINEDKTNYVHNNQAATSVQSR